MVPYSNGELAQMEQEGKNMKQPITMTIVDKIAEEIQKDTEAKVYKAVLDIGITINKAELIRALELDKELREGKLVEVVRCKDCKNYRPFYWDKGICDLWATDGIDVFNDGFCNYGKRRDPNANLTATPAITRKEADQ